MINIIEHNPDMTTRAGEYLGRPAIEVHGAPVNGHPWMYRNAGDAFYVYYLTPFAPEDKNMVEIRREPSSPEGKAAIPPPENLDACVKFALALIRTDQPTIKMPLPADRWYRPDEFNSRHPDYGTAEESSFTLIGGNQEGPRWFPAFL